MCIRESWPDTGLILNKGDYYKGIGKEEGNPRGGHKRLGLGKAALTTLCLRGHKKWESPKRTLEGGLTQPWEATSPEPVAWRNPGE